MKKKSVIISNLVLLCWFALDMIGIDLGNVYLVTQSWREDGVFFLVFLSCLLLFILREKVGKYVLAVWLAMWLLGQLLSHELYTVIGGGEGVRRFFAGALHWVHSETRYFPDVYHMVLHILIVIALVITVSYLIKSRASRREDGL